MKKRYLIPLLIILALPVAAWLALKLPVFGAIPSKTDHATFASSPAFNSSSNSFENRRPELFTQMRENSSIPGMLREWFKERVDSKPNKPLPEVKPDFQTFLASSNNTKLIWLGHSSFLLNINSTVVLVDPIFSNAAAPVSFLAPRFQAPVITLNELPPIDIILISHDHYDHLDKKTAQHFVNTPTQFITPLGVGLHLKRWGISDSQLTELDWWQSHTVNEIQFVAAPAQHFSGRDGLNNNKTLWASWVVKASNASIYYSGDSGYDTHFKTIGEQYGPFDLALMENGQYNEGWPAVHMFPEEALQASKDVQAKALMPVHWGMFELSFHSWYEPAVRIAALAKESNFPLLTPTIGDIIEINGQFESNPWWEQ